MESSRPCCWTRSPEIITKGHSSHCRLQSPWFVRHVVLYTLHKGPQLTKARAGEVYHANTFPAPSPSLSFCPRSSEQLVRAHSLQRANALLSFRGAERLGGVHTKDPRVRIA